MNKKRRCGREDKENKVYPLSAELINRENRSQIYYKQTSATYSKPCHNGYKGGTKHINYNHKAILSPKSLFYSLTIKFIDLFAEMYYNNFICRKEVL